MTGSPLSTSSVLLAVLEMRPTFSLARALTARGFKVSSFETAKEAAEYLNTQIDGATVGFGGSITLEELGLYALLSGHNTVFSHWHLPEGGDVATLRAQAATSEHYLLSANGIAETGEIINIDGAGNRVASAIYGHKKVWIVVGKNKLAPTYDEALWRARNIAAPKNAQRLHAKTPCAGTWTGGGGIWLPYIGSSWDSAQNDATAAQLIDCWFLSAGESHEWRLPNMLYARPGAELRKAFAALTPEQAAELETGLRAVWDDPLYAESFPGGFDAKCNAD